MALRKD